MAIVAALADKLGHDVTSTGQTVWAEVNWTGDITAGAEDTSEGSWQCPMT
jgi:hypothetical protein